MFHIKRSKSKNYFHVVNHSSNVKDNYKFGNHRINDCKRFVIAASTFIITFCATNFLNDSVLVAKNDEIEDETILIEMPVEEEQQSMFQFQDEDLGVIRLEEIVQKDASTDYELDAFHLNEEYVSSNQFTDFYTLEDAHLDLDSFQETSERNTDVIVDCCEDSLVTEMNSNIQNSFSHNMVHDICGGYFEEIEKKQSQRDAYEASHVQWICEYYGMSDFELETFVNSFIQTSQKLETGFYDETTVYDYLYKVAQVSNSEKELSIMEKLGLTFEQFQTVVNTFLGEAACSYSDGYAVASVGLLRTASDRWVRSHGSSIYHQVVAPSQFAVYYTGDYLNFSEERDSVKYQGILDALYSQCPLHTYGNFEASFSNRQLFQFVNDGNKYRKEVTDLDASVFQEAATNFVDVPREIVLAKECSY